MLGFSILETVEFLLIIILCLILIGLILKMRQRKFHIERAIHDIETDHFFTAGQAKGVEKCFVKLSEKILKWIYSTLKASTKITDDVDTIYHSCEVSESASNKIKETFNQFDKQSKEVVSHMEVLQNIAEDTYQTHQNIQHLSRKAAKYAKETGDFIQSGSNSITETVAILENMNQHIESVTAMSNELVDKVKAVDNMANLITDLAENINLLSLNASIEAARAGDAGRGFAVVATQINKLADQSSDYAKHIMTSMKSIKEKSLIVEDGISILSSKREAAHESIEGITTYFQGIHKDSDKIIRAVHAVDEKIEEGVLSSEKIKESCKQVTTFLEAFQKEIILANEEIALQYHSEQRNLESCNAMKQTVENMLVFTATFESIISDKLLSHCEKIADMLNQKSCSNNDIIAYCNTNGISEVYITDADGVTELSNNPTGIGFRFPENKEAQAYEFRKILKDSTKSLHKTFKKEILTRNTLNLLLCQRKDARELYRWD